MIEQPLEIVLHKAFVAARQKRHEFITIEHLLLHLLDEPTAIEVFDALKVDRAKLRKQLGDFVEEHTPKIPKSKEVDTQPTLGFQRVIQRAILHVQSSGKANVSGRNVLVAVFGEKDSHAVHFLTEAGVTRLDVVNYISRGTKSKAARRGADEQLVSELQEFSSVDRTKPRRERKVPTQEAIPKVFISYSHVDAECVSRLLVHLKPLERQKAILSWSDQRIRAGDKWREQIEANLKEAAVAVLLVSADFLASDFIVDNELPPLLARAESKGLRILQIVLKPCGFNRDVILSKFQAVNDPRKPLLGLDHIGQEAIYDQVAEEIAREIQVRLKAN